MKKSQYNHIFENSDKVLFFNSLSENFFEVDSARVDSYTELLNNPDLYKDDFKEFFELMMNKGFVTEKNEEELVRMKYDRLRRPFEYHLMILTTYQCNLRCWYCTQDHKNLWMDDKTVEQIKDLITRKLDNPEITQLHVSWFGGEPLMAYDRLVELTRFAKNLTEKLGKTFSCYITTNSTLLTPKRIEELKELGITSYQITLDGPKEIHDSVKKLPGKSAFDTALKNIDQIARHTNCTLRFNYTHENLEPEKLISQIRERLSEESLKNIDFMPQKVWQEEANDVPTEKLDRLFELSHKINLNTKTPSGGICYVDQKYYDCVYPDGRIGKCDNEPPESARGHIESGKVVWDSEYIAHTPVFQMEDTVCHSCSFLPFCWGPCITRREKMLMEAGKIYCQFKDPHAEMAPRIKRIYEEQKRLFDSQK